MKVLIFGGKGQLGRALTATAPQGVDVVVHDIDTIDITNHSALRAVVVGQRPCIIFNAAAYTAVDKAESEEELALAINGIAVGALSSAAQEVGARFVHVSTDFVFDGMSGIPYTPDARPNPLNAYGRTKLVGEKAAKGDAIIVRTAWVYSAAGNNFVRTMLRLMNERSQVAVVADQIGTPTYAPGLAKALWVLADKNLTGIQHFTDAGVASWYDFAVAIQEEALEIGLLNKAVPIIPISTLDFPTAAKRPNYSVLNNTGTYTVLGRPAPHWRVNLRDMLRLVATQD